MTTHELASVSLDDKYTATTRRVYLSGIQALVRLATTCHGKPLRLSRKP